MRFLAVLTALALGACAFSSEQAFFGPDEAAHPFAEGSRYSWTEVSGAPQQVTLTFTQTGATYSVAPDVFGQPPFEEMLLAALPDTPEEDYVLQWRFQETPQLWAYAFVWRVDGGYRLVVDARAFPESAPVRAQMGAFCREARRRGCVFGSRDHLLVFYRDHVYPTFVAGGATPARYGEMRPVAVRGRAG